MKELKELFKNAKENNSRLYAIIMLAVYGFFLVIIISLSLHDTPIPSL